LEDFTGAELGGNDVLQPPAYGETGLGGAELGRNGVPWPLHGARPSSAEQLGKNDMSRPPVWGQIELSGAGSMAARTHAVLPTCEAGRHSRRERVTAEERARVGRPTGARCSPGARRRRGRRGSAPPPWSALAAWPAGACRHQASRREADPARLRPRG
jgi:hypothetical protein